MERDESGFLLSTEGKKPSRFPSASRCCAMPRTKTKPNKPSPPSPLLRRLETYLSASRHRRIIKENKQADSKCSALDRIATPAIFDFKKAQAYYTRDSKNKLK